mmetsp:Transcript_3134/g.10973  ORF Transcript_3134/g.10973 Transcript_3134/m.10973 type:complete len:170 (+) Transcript_3134:74-583(+)
MALARVAREVCARHARGIHTTAAAAAAAGAPSLYTRIMRFVDGKIFWQVHTRKGELVGEDQFGNKYYENRDYQWSRDRWVVYCEGTDQEADYNASGVPPAWHAWLHHVSDSAPHNSERLVPAYERDERSEEGLINKTGTKDAYQPKGSQLNKYGVRSWQRYEAWKPPAP